MTDSNVREIGTLHSEYGSSEFAMPPNELIFIKGMVNNLVAPDIVSISRSPLHEPSSPNETGLRISNVRRIKPLEGPKFVDLITYRNKMIRTLRSIENLTLTAPIQDSYKELMVESFKRKEERMKKVLSSYVEHLTEMMLYDTDYRRQTRLLLRHHAILQEKSLMRPVRLEKAYPKMAITKHINLEECNSNINTENAYLNVTLNEHFNTEEGNSDIDVESV